PYLHPRPHPTTPATAAESALPVVRRDPHALHARHRVEHGARRVVNPVVPPEVAGIVVRDGLGHPAADLELALRDEPVDELQRMDDLVRAAQLRVLVGDGVETVRAARDDLADAVLLEGLDV